MAQQESVNNTDNLEYLNLTLKEICNVTNSVKHSLTNLEAFVTEVVINSKEIKPGSLFVAIEGLNHDGHNYIQEAFEKGAVAALVCAESSNIKPNSTHLIYVDDTVKALGDIAKYYRKKFNIPVIAVTGSNGKTTIKEMLRSIFAYQLKPENVLASSDNFNNHLGLPLSILKLRPSHKVAIFEMGMSDFGEISYLTHLASPTIAAVNNVLRAHIEAFDGLMGIAKAKGEIYSGLAENSIACININEPMHKVWFEMVPRLAKIIEYGNNKTSYYFEYDEVNQNALFVTPQGRVTIKLKVLGIHNYNNALTALILAMESGCSLENITKGLIEFPGFKQRLEQKTAFNGALIIDDTYNANPDSTKAAILTLKHFPKPHWFILGDLKGLGEEAPNYHLEVANYLNEHKIEKLLTIGELTKFAHNGFKGAKEHFDTQEQIVEYCLNNLPVNATLLIKGSRTMALENVVNKLLIKNI